MIERKTEEHGAENLPLVREILNNIELFKECIIFRMRETPEVEQMHVSNLYRCQAKIAEILPEFETLQNITKEQNSTYEILLKDIVACIENEEGSTRAIRKLLEIEIPKEIEKSMSKILAEKKQEETLEKLLRSDINSTEQRLCRIIEINGVTEKKFFDTCATFEREYRDLLNMYDRNIGTLYALIDNLLRENESLLANKKNMENRLVTQRASYIQLRQEREITLIRAFTEQLEQFRQNRASKIIQRAWRAYFEHISLKKRRKARKK